MSRASVIDYEEPEDAALRANLGLRPIIYKTDDATADARPCPSWCWIGKSGGEYEHAVDARQPMSATHSMEASATAVLRGDEADISVIDGERFVHTATIEPWLEQVGGSEPTIRIALRHAVDRRPEYVDDLLSLSLDDARELATVLTFLAETGDKG